MRRLLAGALLLAACSDFVAPPRPVPLAIQTIAVGKTVPVALVSGDSFRAFTFAASVDSTYSVEVVPGSGTVTVTVLDSIHLVTSGFVLASSTTPPGRRWTQTVAGVAGDPWLIRVGPSLPGQAGSVTMTVHQVATGPEHIPSTILLDSVYGTESLDAYDDIDRFTFTGTPGQLIEVFLQGTASVDPGQYVCLVLDPLAAPPLAVAFSQAGDTALEASLTGRVKLFHGGQYLVEVKSSRNGCGTAAGANDPYLGPYLMRVQRIDTLPEVAADSFAVGDTVKTEAIDQIGDIDVFRLRGTPGQLVNLQLQSPVAGRALQVVVSGAATTVSTSSYGYDASLDLHVTGRFALPASGRVTARVTGVLDGRGGDAGPYRLYAYPVNPAPEHLPAAIAPGDTIAGEVIDHIGDVDEFTFPATQGQQFDAFFEVLAGPYAQMTLQVLRPDSGQIASVFRTGADTGLLLRSTGRFTASTTGTYTLRIQGQSDQSPTDLGPYRFLVYPVNPAPETASPVLAFGDSVSNETIDFPGDLDEFHTVISDSSGANIVLIADSNAQYFPISVSLVDSSTGSTIAGVEADNGAFPFQTGILSPAPCHCLLRVAGGFVDFDPGSVFRGGYTLKFYKFSFGPEKIGDTVAIGDTIAGETINPPGDRDDFVFFGKKGQHVNLSLEGLGAASPGAFSLGIEDGPGLPSFLFVTSPTSPDSLHAHRSNRIDLPVTGWYGLTVVGQGSQNPLTAPGPYTVSLERVATGPEHGTPTFAAGDSVTNEAIDYPGDWDEFTLTGTPGQKVSLAFTIAAVPGNPVLEVFDSAADSVIASAVGQPGVQVAGPVVIPATGQLVVRVYEPRPGFSTCTDSVCNGIFAFTGGYQIVTSIVP